MESRFRSSLFSFLVYAAFFASGAASLIAEVTWNRMLIVVVGNSLSAAAMIIVVFMGGLGLGSVAGGKVFGKRPASLVPYFLLETAVGLYVLLSPGLFDLLSGIFTSLAGQIGTRGALTLIRVVVSMAALLVPAFLMGATFPAMISATATDVALKRTARTGYLYSINTLGAAVGCFAAGYHLLLEFGVRTTLACAFGLYLFAAVFGLAAYALARGERRASQESLPPAETVTIPDDDGGRRRFLYLATFGIGFVALAYEVLLTRLSILYLGNSISVFPLVLTAFLLGTGISATLGTKLYGVLERLSGNGDRLFGITAIAAGAFVLGTPYMLLTDLVLGVEQFARFSDASAPNPWPILGIIVAPTILLGALLPIAIRMLHREDRSRSTRTAATLYALNTGGGLLGAGLANHFLVPAIGVQGVLLCLLAICWAAGFIPLLARSRNLNPGRSAPRWGIAALAVALAVVILHASLPRMVDLYARRLAQQTEAAAAKVLLVREGRAATVTVLDQSDPKLGTYRDMYLNGVEEASTRYWHTQLFKLLGMLPVALHESDHPKDVLVIAFGAGITAGSVLASDDVGSLDVVDLNPDIEGINDLFREVNGDVYHKARFHFHNDDGRNYLVTSGKAYDLIISDSTHPRAYDSWILYTAEFYRSVKRRLLPGGTFAQWVPVLGSMQGDLFRIHLNTFRSVFPHATLWYVYGSDQAFLLATPEPLSIDPDRLQSALDRLPAWFRADEYQIDTVARIGGFFWLDEANMAKMIGPERRLNTDDTHYFDKQSAVRPAPPQFRLPAFQATVVASLINPTPSLRSAVSDEQRAALLLSRYGFYDSRNDLYDAYCFLPENGNVRYFMEREFSGELPDHETFCRDREVETYRSLVAQHPNNAVALNALADALCEAGKLDEARPLAEKAVALDPGNGMILDTYGWILHKQGSTRESIEVLEKSASLLPDQPIVLYHLGAAHHAAKNDIMARRSLERALSLSSEFPGAKEARDLLRDLD